MGHYRDVAADLRIPTKTLRTASPDVWAGFGALHQAAVAASVVEDGRGVPSSLVEPHAAPSRPATATVATRPSRPRASD